MSQEATIRKYVNELRREHGADAPRKAEENMRAEMNKGDVSAAGIWLSVMYELTRTEAKA